MRVIILLNEIDSGLVHKEREEETGRDRESSVGLRHFQFVSGCECSILID